MADLNPGADLGKKGEASRKDGFQASSDTNAQDSNNIEDGVSKRDIQPKKDEVDQIDNNNAQEGTSTSDALPNKQTSSAGGPSAATQEYDLRLYNLTYANAQIDVATNALDQAYRALCELDRHLLLSRPLRAQTKSIRRNVDRIIRLAEGGPSADAGGGEGGEDEETSVGHAPTKSLASETGHDTAEASSQTPPPLALSEEERQCFYTAVISLPPATPPHPSPPSFADITVLLSAWNPAGLRRAYNNCKAHNHILDPKVQKSILYTLKLMLQVHAGADPKSLFLGLYRDARQGHDVIGYGDLVGDRREMARLYVTMLWHLTQAFPVFVRALGLEALGEEARRERLKTLMDQARGANPAPQDEMEYSGVVPGPGAAGATDGSSEEGCR